MLILIKNTEEQLTVDQPYASKESIERGDKQMAANKALAILAADTKEENL